VADAVQHEVNLKARGSTCQGRVQPERRWPANHLDNILNGRTPPGRATPEQAVSDLASAKNALRLIGEKLDNLNGKLDALLKHYDIKWQPGQSSGISVDLEGYGHSYEPPEPGDGEH
jgi:hypothetical protein